ncbi:tetratricopeptide repeat protein [Catenovulum sediminis]|uniref:Uncharacterized protein n=1 Tax=Catenovulum sediminis TaxID=1740262 RepID=A0ABV1RG77_9ALTE
MSELILSLQNFGSQTAEFTKLMAFLNNNTSDFQEFPPRYPINNSAFTCAVSTGMSPINNHLFSPQTYNLELGRAQTIQDKNLPYKHLWQITESYWVVNWPATQGKLGGKTPIISPDFITPTSLNRESWATPFYSFNQISYEQADLLRMHPEDFVESDFKDVDAFSIIQQSPESVKIFLTAIAHITSIQNYARYFTAKYPNKTGAIHWPLFAYIESICHRLPQQQNEIKSAMTDIALLFISQLLGMFDSYRIIADGFSKGQDCTQFPMAFYCTSKNIQQNRSMEISKAEDIFTVLVNNKQHSVKNEKYIPFQLTASMSAKVRAEYAFLKAETYNSNGEKEKALISYQQAVKIYNDHPLFLFRTIQTCIELGQYENAQSYLVSINQKFCDRPGYKLLQTCIAIFTDNHNSTLPLSTLPLPLQLQTVSLLNKAPSLDAGVKLFTAIEHVIDNSLVKTMCLYQLKASPSEKFKFDQLLEQLPKRDFIDKVKAQLANQAIAQNNFADLIKYI